MPATEAINHISLDARGIAWIVGKNVKVLEIVQDHLAYGWSAETIQENHPHLSLAQVYAALAWYYDHQSEMDAEIERQGERLQTMRATAKDSPLARRALRRGQ